jgi:carbon-monoxide dehydrogenase medium subunit
VIDFTYHRPGTVEEACALGAELGDDARFLAGGTELLTDLKRDRIRPRHVVSLRDVAGLDGIRRDPAFLRIGALARLEAVAGSDLVRETFPALAEAAAAIGCVQIREQATIGGNFCGAVPCADTPPACIAGRARVRLVRSGGERTLAAEEFFRAPRETALEPGELLAEILLPCADGGSAYERHALRRGMAVAVASVAAAVALEDGRIREARIALGAVAPVPLFAEEASAILAGKEPGPEAFAEAAEIAAREAKPICDVRGSDEHRRLVVAALARRALARAAEVRS